jgi:hypothetical protein
MAKHCLLSSVEVIAVTDMAIQIAWTEQSDDKTHWIPRSLCEDGDRLDVGDTDVSVAKWFAIKEDLPWEN